jgi:hypothetical protein
VNKGNFVLDENKRRTYKNECETRQEAAMLAFVKDLMAFISLSAFSVTILTWADIVTRIA